jgi:hypothetical protein
MLRRHSTHTSKGHLTYIVVVTSTFKPFCKRYFYVYYSGAHSRERTVVEQLARHYSPRGYGTRATVASFLPLEATHSRNRR